MERARTLFRTSTLVIATRAMTVVGDSDSCARACTDDSPLRSSEHLPAPYFTLALVPHFWARLQGFVRAQFRMWQDWLAAGDSPTLGSGRSDQCFQVKPLTL